MNTIYCNANVPDDLRRERLYNGQLYVYTANDSTRALCQHAREMCEEAFAPYHPTEAQFHMPVEKYVEILAALKPNFIHHPRSKECIQAILAEANCDLEKTFFDVPRLRTVTCDGYLSSGLGYAFKPHRDTWYSPPMCQINWWLPVYDIESENGMAFHMHYWDRAIQNDSHDFDYQRWQQTGRKNAAKHVKKDTRKQTEATEELKLDPEVRVITERDGLLIFSAAHLHSTVPNMADRTRISIDFRTVHLDDLRLDRGAPNLDSACTGTTIRDYLRGSDCMHLPDKVISHYEETTKPSRAGSGLPLPLSIDNNNISPNAFPTT